MSNIITRDYNGNVFQFREDGYFNMTKAAKEFGKEVKEFLRLPSTNRYVEALEKVGFSRIYESHQGRNGGTWGHPKLAVFFARWLDVKFAVFCDMVIHDILNKKAELTITKPEESAVMNRSQSFADALRLAAELEEKRVALKQENTVLLPKAEGCDATVSNNDLYTSTQVAHLLGFQSAIAVDRVLRHIGWKSRRDADTPSKRAVDKGWLVVRMLQRAGSYDSIPEVFVTQKGFDELSRIIGGSAIEVA